MKPIFAAIAVVLYASAPTTGALEAQMIDSKPLPFVDATKLMGGYSLRVPHHGSFRWNGQHIGPARLRLYFHQLAALPNEWMFLAFEPKTPEARIVWVRRQVIDSGLCKQRRCAEIGWNVKRPFVN